MKDLLILLSSRYYTSDHDTADLYTTSTDTMDMFYLILGFSSSVFWLLLLFCCLGPFLIWCGLANNAGIDLESATPRTSIALPQGYVGGRLSPQGYIGGQHLMRDRAKSNMF